MLCVFVMSSACDNLYVVDSANSTLRQVFEPITKSSHLKVKVW
jgi:hypothetical protein